MSEFQHGEADAANTAGPSITQTENIGATYRITATKAAPLIDTGDLHEPYLMPSVHGRNGSMEVVDPAITLTPLGGMMPGPQQLPPVLDPSTCQGTHPMPTQHPDFNEGVIDGWPEGPPVPVK